MIPAGIFAMVSVVGGVLPPPTSAQAEDVVRACDGDDEWPPYSFFAREGGVETDRIVGFVPTLVREALAGSGYRVEIEKESSWPRCLEYVRSGESRQMAIQAAWSAEREEDYRLSDPIYTVTPSYFYSLETFPGGLELASIQEAAGHRICGVAGFNYAYEGLDPSRIDQTSQDYPTVIRHLHRGRCDLFLESAPILQGLSDLEGGWLDDPRLRWAALPNVEADAYHVLVSRRWSGGEAFLRELNDGLRRLRESGRRAELEAEFLE